MHITKNEIVNDPDGAAMALAASYRYDPAGWACAAYEWGKGELAGSAGPRAWQAEVLGVIRDHLTSRDRFQPLQIAVASGHGIGKSALIGMVINWAMSTCPDCRVVVTANTEMQLRTKTWPEINKWFRSAFNAHWFEINATSIHGKDQAHEKSWRADAIPWSENNTEAFAGLHNEGKRILVVYDEGSAISDKIFEVTEGALTDSNTEIIWLVFGNPTRNTGRFRACFGRYRHRWVTRKIDSRTVEGTNKALLDRWAHDYGEDSDFYRVRVRGEFPAQSSNQLISEAAVEACRAFKALAYESFPVRITCDVARFGEDSTVIMAVQGRKIVDCVAMQGKDTVAVYSRIVEMYNYWLRRQDRVVCFVDDVGVGGGVTDMIRAAHIPVVGVNSGGAASDGERFINKRMEMWWDMAEALKEGVDLSFLPHGQYDRLKDDLVNIEYFMQPRNQKYQLESVDDLKERGLPSPDYGTALALSFAYPVPHAVQSGEGLFRKAESATKTTLGRKRGV